MLKGVDGDDVDQFLDVVVVCTLTEVDPTAVVSLADGIEVVARISTDCVSAYSVEKLSHFVTVVFTNPLACSSREQ